MNFNSLDFQSIWEDTMGWNTYLPDSRKFNDKIESDFWIRLAPLYTEKYNLNADTDKIAAKLHELLGDNHSILEIGCGSGNFTMLMAEYSRKVHGVDFSPAMLEELHKRAEAAGIGNVTAEVSKWEDYVPEGKSDYIVSVNSLYRIADMQSALQKMDYNCRMGTVIVRTVQRPFLYPLYEKCGISGIDECVDYQLIPCMLWRMGIKANVDFINYEKVREYENVSLITDEIYSDLGREVYDKNRDLIESELNKNIICKNSIFTLNMPRTTVFIYWNK